jgi:phosphatidylglycerol:prolipoprotein diacylglycerol transferase
VLPQIHLLGLDIQTFGLMVLVAYVCSLAMLNRRARELDLPTAWVNEVALTALVGGIVGARMWALLQNRDELAASGASAFSGKGLVWYGGLVGGTLAVAAWRAWRRAPILVGLDIFGPMLAMDYALGRIGCQLSGDGDYGVASDLPWAMGYPDGTVPTPPGVEVHPAPVYEALAMSLVAWWLWRRRDAHPPGVVFGLYLVLAGIERFAVEFIRRNSDVALGLTAAQLFSVVIAALGVAFVVGASRRQAPAPARRLSGA